MERLHCSQSECRLKCAMNIKRKVLNFEWKSFICLSLFFSIFCAVIAYYWCVDKDAWQIASNENKDYDEDGELIFDLSTSEIKETNEIISDDKLYVDVSNKDVNIYSRFLRRKCKNATFGLPGMDACHQWLNCSNLENEIKILREIGGGAVKKVRVFTLSSHR